MPELPDVEVFRHVLAAHALRKRIAHVAVRDRRSVAPISPRKLETTLRGRRFVSTKRHGKHLLVRLDQGGWLTMHFGMTGQLVYVSGDKKPPRFARVVFEIGRGCLVFADPRKLGRVGLADDANAFIAEHDLGPDAMAKGFNLAAFKAALKGRRTSIKAALMDQAAMAGIGNIYSDEILFQARINPRRATVRLNDRELARLFHQMKRVLATATARHAGSEDFFERLPRGYLLPHRRKGGECPRCGGAVRVLKMGGRTAYYCPRCQS